MHTNINAHTFIDTYIHAYIHTYQGQCLRNLLASLLGLLDLDVPPLSGGELGGLGLDTYEDVVPARLLLRGVLRQ